VSSNREKTPCQAYLSRENDGSERKDVGPLRLPRKEPASFIEQFNRTYGKLGLRILRVPKPIAAEQAAPASQDDSDPQAK